MGRGLEDLLHKCLAHDRESRYADAGELATDLRRHIANLPLRGVANRGLKERWQKWRRRKPHALSIWTVSLTALAVIGGACAIFYSDRVQTARSALGTGGARPCRRRPRQCARSIDNRTASDSLVARATGPETEPSVAIGGGTTGTRHRSIASVGRATTVFGECRRRSAGQAARIGCRLSRDLGGQEPNRHARAGPIWQQQGSNEEIDLLDLALLWTRLATRSPAADASHSAQAKALTVLDQAEAMWGPSPALALARAQLAGEPVSSDSFVARLSTEMPRAAWEHDAVGRMLLQAGKLEQAREMFEQATQLDPGAFWPAVSIWRCAPIAASNSKRLCVPPVFASPCLRRGRNVFSTAVSACRPWDRPKQRCGTLRVRSSWIQTWQPLPCSRSRRWPSWDVRPIRPVGLSRSASLVRAGSGTIRWHWSISSRGIGQRHEIVSRSSRRMMRLRTRLSLRAVSRQLLRQSVLVPNHRDSPSGSRPRSSSHALPRSLGRATREVARLAVAYNAVRGSARHSLRQNAH